MNRILVDTNVLIYIKDSSSFHHREAIKIMDEGGELFLTSKNLTEYYSVVTKGLQPLLTPAEALKDITEFISHFTVLYPSNASHQKLSELILRLNPKGLLVHYFEIAAIGLVSGVNKIATFNKADYASIIEIDVVPDI